MMSVEHMRRLNRMRRLAKLLDAKWRVPVVGWRIGIDPLLGLLPGGGDLVAMLISSTIIYHAYRMGAGPGMLLRMGANVGIDFVLGTVPVLGDIFDWAFKANVRNVRLLERWAQTMNAVSSPPLASPMHP